jgi:uncharacterized integral membrane protein
MLLALIQAIEEEDDSFSVDGGDLWLVLVALLIVLVVVLIVNNFPRR